MALRIVTWILILGCLAALAVSAPATHETSGDVTTVAALTLPAELPTEKKTKRETDKPAEDSKPTEVSVKPAISNGEQHPEPAPPKPTADTHEAKKDDSTHKDKRDTEEKKDEEKKPTSTDSKPENRPQRDVTGTEQPQKLEVPQPAPDNGEKKEDKPQ